MEAERKLWEQREGDEEAAGLSWRDAGGKLGEELQENLKLPRFPPYFPQLLIKLPPAFPPAYPRLPHTPHHPSTAPKCKRRNMKPHFFVGGDPKGPRALQSHCPRSHLCPTDELGLSPESKA